ncbi:hypothetical protein VCRA2121O337_260009 [Vibrio crassostreae]|nr:hypothetical protein VCRA2120E331_260079 [Vibrio crassostreae]CAK3376340.1 hypothetical protein VCRA2127O345_260079 [Vibrio crassostreae]CAK3382246.1 hypothetical protein VCRA2120E330_250079 [Vibrio crassostreae]CAK3413986.1 hypothetical protein VCRA2122O338_260080 [Vibrio crassostreae]CAK3470886.1 hypothetical protein VCRA2122O340_260009 [Vibrio crassostreae]
MLMQSRRAPPTLLNQPISFSQQTIKLSFEENLIFTFYISDFIKAILVFIKDRKYLLYLFDFIIKKE